MLRWLHAWLTKLWTTDRAILGQTQELMRQMLRIEQETDTQLARIEQKLDALAPPAPEPAVRLITPVGIPTDQPREEEKPPMAAAVSMTGVQQFDIGPITAVDRHGNAAPLDGPPTFTSSDETIATVGPHPSGDVNMALCKGVGPNGAAQITISADADLGEGVKALEDFVGVNIVPEEAVGLVTPVGAVTDQ